MNLRHLEILRAVVEGGTATAAAQRVRLTQSAVSRSIAALEQEIGFRLFDRIKQRLVLTKEGGAFFQETERLLSGLDELKNVAGEIRDKTFARLRLVAMPAIAHGLLPAALAQFQKAHPRLSVSVEIRRRSEVTRWIAGRQFDVGFAALPANYPGVISQHLFTAAAVVALPSNHRLAQLSTIAPSQLEKEDLIGLGSDAMVQSKIGSYFQERGFVPRLKIESSSLLSVCHFVAAGLGCGIVDPFTASSARSEQIVFRPLRPELKIEYGALFQKGHATTPLAKDLCAHVRGVASELSAAIKRG